MSEESLGSLVVRVVSGSGRIEQAVFVLLFVFSLVSWCIIFWKICDVYDSRRKSRRFLKAFDAADCLGSAHSAAAAVGACPLVAVFRAGMASLDIKQAGLPAGGLALNSPGQIPLKPASAPQEILMVSMQHQSQLEFAPLQRGLGFLATIGSTSPFIGLFGTVWGIMDTFRELGSAPTASIQVVAPGISSSLIATAAGLAVAIPAVMAYNWFLAEIDSQRDLTDRFIERMAVVVSASGFFAKRQVPSLPPHQAAATTAPVEAVKA